MKIFLWAADEAGSGWYRMALPAQGLAWLGHEVGASTGLPAAWQDYADAVIASRVALSGASKIWRRLRDQGKQLILDLDDDYWHIDPLNVQAHSEWDSTLLRRLEANLGIANLVTVVSENLAAEVRQHTDTPVRVIPNALPAQLMSHVRDYKPDKIRVGWAGTASTVHDLPQAARALRLIAERPDVEVRLVGIPPEVAYRAGCRHGEIKTFGWVAQKNYLDVVNTFDIWVAPYRDTAFNRCKYPTKALEAGMLGIPLLASAIDPYAAALAGNQGGLLVHREHEWTRLLRQLVEDASLREALGTAGRGRASANILQSVNQQWEDACRPAAQ